MAKRPKDMTFEELNALPTKGWVDYREGTPEEVAAKGLPLGTTLRIPIATRANATVFAKDDLAFARLPDGQTYTFGQLDDGSWFKRPIWL